MPRGVKLAVGAALAGAQLGGKSPIAKVLKGFGDASLLEIIEDDSGGTYRAVYTVRFAGVVYVLHAFQKKSKSAIKTTRADIALIKQRLNAAKEHYYADYQKE